MAVSREYKVKIKATIDTAEISKQLESLNKNSKLKFDTGGIDSANKSIGKTSTSVKGLGSLVDGVFGKFNLWYGVAQISHQVYSAIGDVVTNTVKLDTALTGLSKVTDMSKQQLKSFASSAGEAGVEIGKTTSEMVDAAAVFGQAGWSDPGELEHLAKMAGMFTNISDTQITTEDSASFLIATMKAFNMTAGDTEHIIDSVNEVSNKYAVSSGDLASSIGRVASTLAISGTSFEETMGLMTGATEIIRNPGKVANGLKTISLRLQGMEEAADGTAVASDGLASKMQEDFSKIGVSITDSNGQIRSTYDILTDVGAQWPQLTANQKAYYAELAAGKNQANIFIALMDNMKTTIEATGTAYNSTGSAATENAKKMDSVQGKMDQFQAAWEKLTTSFMSGDFLKGIVSAGTAFIQFADSGVGKATIALLAFSAGTVGFISKLAQIMELTSAVGKAMSGVKVATMTGELASVGAAAEGATGSAKGLAAGIAAIGGAPVLGAIAGVVAAVGAIVIGYQAYRKSVDDAYNAVQKQAASDSAAAQEQSAKTQKLRDDLAGVDAQIAAIKDKGTLSITDQADLTRLERQREELSLILASEERLEATKNKVAKASVEAALAQEKSFGMFEQLGSLQGQTVKTEDSVTALSGELVKLTAQYNAMSKAQQDGPQGQRVQTQMDAVKTKTIEQAKVLQDLANQITGTDQASVDMRNRLLESIDAGINATESLSPVPGKILDISKAFGDMKVNLNNGESSIRDLSNGLQDVYVKFESGQTTAREFGRSVTEGFDSINTDEFRSKVQMAESDVANLSQSEQNEIHAMKETWAAYGEAAGEALQGVTESFDINKPDISGQMEDIQTLQDRYLEYYTTQEGLHQNEQGQWVNSAGLIDTNAQLLQNNIDLTNGLSAATDAVSGSQEFLASVSSATSEGIATDSWWAAQEQTTAYQTAKDNFNTSMGELKVTNYDTWAAVAQTVATTIGGPGAQVNDYFDTGTGLIKSGAEITAQSVSAGFSTMGAEVSKGMDGIKTSGTTAFDGIKNGTNEAIAALGRLPGEAAKIESALTNAGKMGGDNLKSAITNGANDGVTSAVGAINSASWPTPTITFKADASAIYAAVPSSISVPVTLTGIPKNAKGTDYFEKTGLSLVGEEGPELVTLPEGAGVATANETRNFRSMLRGGRSLSNAEGSYSDGFEDVIKPLVKVVKSLGDSVMTLGVGARSASTPQATASGGAKSRAASYDDPHKKNFDAAYDELKYLQDMDRISDQEYINRLEGLNNSYYGGRIEYLEEYRKYEVEVYKGRKKQQDQETRDREKAEKDRVQAVKDNFKKEEDALEYMRDKDLITEDEYYRQLAALNDKYFKGKTEYLDEYQKYEIKVYEYLKKKEEERLKELKKKTEAQYENTKDYIVDMIDKQIDAEDEKLKALEKEKDEQDKLKKIEEARKKLAEAQNNKVLVYREGQGFVYEADASAVEEATNDLNEILEEDKFDSKKEEIEAEIDRLDKLKDAWKDSLDINEDLEKYGTLLEWIRAFEEGSYEDRLSMAEQFRDSYRKTLEDIANAQAGASGTASTQMPQFKTANFARGYAKGSDYIRSNEYAMVGENGAEMVNLPKGAGVLNANETKNMRAWGNISPLDLFSNIKSILSNAPQFSFESGGNAPTFDFSSWNLNVETENGLVDAIRNNLKETVIQYMSKRDR